MVLLAISILIGQAVKRPDMRPKWAEQPTNSVVSSGWQTEARRADAEIQTLRSSSQQRRAEVFRTLQSEMRRQMYSPNMKVDPKLVYRGARLSLAFHPETKSKESVFEYACDYFPGSRDPEFRRAVYEFWCFKWSPGYWPRLGRELLSIFPNDKALQQAFTIDAHHGSLDIPELDKAAKLYKSNLAFGSEKFKQEAFWGAIYLHRYFKSKLKSDLDSAILHLSAHVKLNPQREKSEISRGWIEVLTKLRAEGKYKAG